MITFAHGCFGLWQKQSNQTGLTPAIGASPDFFSPAQKSFIGQQYYFLRYYFVNQSTAPITRILSPSTSISSEVENVIRVRLVQRKAFAVLTRPFISRLRVLGDSFDEVVMRKIPVYSHICKLFCVLIPIFA